MHGMSEQSQQFTPPEAAFGLATPYRDVTCGELGAVDAGREIRIAGWVHRRRDYGGLIFIDLRDRYGLTQIVINEAEAPGGLASRGRFATRSLSGITGRLTRGSPGP